MRSTTRFSLTRQVCESTLTAALGFAYYVALTVVVALLLSVVVALLPIAAIAGFALAGYGLALLAYREIVPAGRETVNATAARELWAGLVRPVLWFDSALQPAPVGVEGLRLAAAIESGECDPSHAGQVWAVLMGQEYHAPVTTPGYGDESAPVDCDPVAPEPVYTPAMSDALSLHTLPADAFAPDTTPAAGLPLPIIHAVESTPETPAEPTPVPTPRKRTAKPTPRKASKAKAAPAPVPVPMASAAQQTAPAVYVKRSGGRYSKVGGRVKAKPGEQTYRHDPAANGGRGGYVAL